jgi:hypothetical protein
LPLQVSKSKSGSGRFGRVSSVRSTVGSVSASTSGSGSGFVTASEGSWSLITEGKPQSGQEEGTGQLDGNAPQDQREVRDDETPRAPGLVPVDAVMVTSPTRPDGLAIKTVQEAEQDSGYLSPLMIAPASASAPSPMKGETVVSLQSQSNNNNINPSGLAPPLGVGARSPSTLPSTMGNPSGLDVIHEHEVHHADGQAVPPLELNVDETAAKDRPATTFPLQEGLDGLGLSRSGMAAPSGDMVGFPKSPVAQSEQIPSSQNELDQDRLSVAMTPAIGASPSSRRSSVTFNEPPILRPTMSRQNSDSPEIFKTPQTTGMTTPSRVTSTSSSISDRSRKNSQGKERDLPRTETKTSFELGDGSDVDEARGRSKSVKRVGLFRRKKKDKEDKRDVSAGELVLSEHGRQPSITKDDGPAKKSTGNKRMSLFDMGSKIKDLMSTRRKDTAPISEPEDIGPGDISTRPEATETEMTPERAELESKIAHVTRRARTSDSQTGEREQMQTPIQNQNQIKTQTPGSKSSRQDSEPSSTSSPIQKTPTRGILKITNDAIDPSFAYDASQSVYSPSRPGSVFFASPAASVFVSPNNSPTGLMLPLPILDDGDNVMVTVPEPSSSTLTRSSDPPGGDGTEHTLGSPFTPRPTGTATGNGDDDHDGDSNSTRTVTPTSSKPAGFGGLAMTSISPTGPADAKNFIPTSTSGESTSSGGTIISPTSDKQANDLIMGALNRKSGGGGHLMHKSPSATSLGSTKTTGALAALGMKAMGPGLGGFSAAEPTVVRSQPVGASSFELQRAKTVDFDTSPQKDTGGLFSAFGGTKEKERGRSSSKSKRDKYKIFSRRSLAAGSAGLGGPRSRETSPVGALSEHAESDGESVTSSSRGYRPKSTAFSAKRRVGDNAEDSDEDDASDEDTDGETETDLDYDESSLSHEIVGEDGWVEDVFDEETEKNTEANAIYFEGDAAGLGGTGVLEDANGEAVEVEVDVLGEGERKLISCECEKKLDRLFVSRAQRDSTTRTRVPAIHHDTSSAFSGGRRGEAEKGDQI